MLARTLPNALETSLSSALSSSSTILPPLIQSTINSHPFLPCLFASGTYMLIANIVYIARRSHLRNMPKRKLLQIRTTREPNTSLRLYVITLLSWQIFVSIFPFVELFVRILFRQVSFFYSYPNAHGVGIILEPLDAQAFSVSKRTKTQIRLDWHRFQINVGGIGRDGYRHPPSKEYNLPHLDIPKKQLKHWPWRRRYNAAEKC